MVNLMMHLILVIYLAIILGLYDYVEGSLPAMMKNSKICKNEVCVKDDIHTLKIIPNKYASEKLNDTLNNVSTVLNDNENFIEEFNTEVSHNETLVTIKIQSDANEKFMSKEDVEYTSEFFEDLKNLTEAPNDSIKAIEVNNEYVTNTKGNSTDQYVPETTPKIIMPTQISPFINVSSFFPNLGNSICSCDMLVNECDINCCCDKDCNYNHWKVFSKCNERTPGYDSDYCFTNNFIFKNNINLKVIQTENKLFCIVKDNLRPSLKYKTKGIIKNLESFNKILPKHFYMFLNKKFSLDFQSERYHAGSPVWIFQSGEIKHFGIPKATVGLNCFSEMHIKFLVDQVEVCSHQSSQNKNKSECKDLNIINYLKKIQIISSPHLLNKSAIFDSEKICTHKACLGVDIYLCQEQGDCILEKETTSPNLECRNTVAKIQYQIWHNGSEGIIKFEAFIWLRNLSREFKGKFLQTTEVKFVWVTSSSKIFKKSGNPGYLAGKPVLVSRKKSINNGTAGKSEVIQLAFDSNYFLNVLGSEKGLCSFQKRIPVNFRENGHYSCSLQLSKMNFSAEKCIELQKYIFQLLLGDDVSDTNGEKYYNKFIATFGNSRLENTEEWVQVLIDLLPVVASQVNFKFGYSSLICKNIISDLLIEVAYSNVGSFLYPQAKILGVFFKFGKHKDFSFNCNMPSCENTNHYQHFKLSSTVHFIDLTEPAIDAFAQPLSLDVRLPRDFFYPFFSKSSISQLSAKFVLGLAFFYTFKICNF